MKHLVSVMLIVSMTFFIAVPRPVEANPAVLAVPAVAVEVGTLAVWGALVLFASVGTAVGMDKELMKDFKEFGRDVWETADEAVRSSISASVEGLKSIWNEKDATAVVTFSSPVIEHLEHKWDSFVGDGVVLDDSNTIVSFSPPVTSGRTVIPSIARPSSYKTYDFEFHLATSAFDRVLPKEDFTDLGSYKTKRGFTRYITEVSVDSVGACTYSSHVFNESGNFFGSSVGDFSGVYPNAKVAYETLFKSLKLQITGRTKFDADFVINQFRGQEKEFFYPSYPVEFPKSLVVPAPRGVVGEKGDVTYEFPSIARNEFLDVSVGFEDIVAGYPTVAGDLEGLTSIVVPSVLSPSIPFPGSVAVPEPFGGIGGLKVPAIPVPGSVAAPVPLGGAGDAKVPAIPIPGSLAFPVPLNPASDVLAQDIAGVRTEVGGITGTISRFFDLSRPVDWGRLRAIPHAFTNSFPFSLPWDVKRAFDVLVETPKLPVLELSFYGGYKQPPIKKKIELPDFLATFAPYIRSFFLFMFTLSLVFSTRKLLGGAQ